MKFTRLSFWFLLSFMSVTVCLQFYFVFVNHYQKYQYLSEDQFGKTVQIGPTLIANVKNDSLNLTSKNGSKPQNSGPIVKSRPAKHLTSRDLFNLVREQNKDTDVLNGNGVLHAVAALSDRFHKVHEDPHQDLPEANPDSGSESERSGEQQEQFMWRGRMHRKRNPADNPEPNFMIHHQMAQEGEAVAKGLLGREERLGVIKPKPLQTNASAPNTSEEISKNGSKHEIGKAVLNGTFWKRYIDRHDYKYIINPADACVDAKGMYRRSQLLILVASNPTNVGRREIIRRTWGMTQYPDIHKRVIQTIFLLGNPHDPDVQMSVEDESRHHGDIIMEDSQDSYLNLTIKTVMGLKWTSRYCPKAKFVMKTDDDMMINTPHLLDVLRIAPWHNYIGGKVAENYPVLRDPKTKFYVPYDLYIEDKYPPFVVGIGYIMSMDLGHNLYLAALRTPLFPWEDAYIGMLLEKMKLVKPKLIKNFFAGGFFDSADRLITHPNMMSVLRKTCTIHRLSVTQMYQVWTVWAEGVLTINV